VTTGGNGPWKIELLVNLTLAANTLVQVFSDADVQPDIDTTPVSWAKGLPILNFFVTLVRKVGAGNE
jgi:hypothetical protein